LDGNQPRTPAIAFVHEGHDRVEVSATAEAARRQGDFCGSEETDRRESQRESQNVSAELAKRFAALTSIWLSTIRGKSRAPRPPTVNTAATTTLRMKAGRGSFMKRILSASRLLKN
jgi:hypothetical protein